MSFGAIADEYDRLRPSPPEIAVDWLVPDHCGVAVDLAAGTGLLTRALARKVGEVVAVEPDERMRAVLRAHSSGVRVLDGTAEAIPLPDASADGVFISSAWHWMDPDLAVPEIGRVLRDGGRLGVIWTSRDREVDWIRKIDWLREPGGLPGPADAEAEAEAAVAGRLRRRHEISLPDTGLFGNVDKATFTFTRTMTVTEIVDMISTYSGLITASPADRADRLGRVRTVIAQQFPDATEIDVPMRSWCWRADRAALAPHP